MDSFTILLISGFFFIMGAAVIGLMWYFQRLTKPKNSKNHNSSDPNIAELARLMRNLQTQEMVVKMDGKTFKAAHELSPTQFRRLSLASNVLLKWLEPKHTCHRSRWKNPQQNLPLHRPSWTHRNLCRHQLS